MNISSEAMIHSTRGPAEASVLAPPVTYGQNWLCSAGSDGKALRRPPIGFVSQNLAARIRIHRRSTATSPDKFPKNRRIYPVSAFAVPQIGFVSQNRAPDNRIFHA